MPTKRNKENDSNPKTPREHTAEDELNLITRILTLTSVLIGLTFIVPLIYSYCLFNELNDEGKKAILEYGKWGLTTLLGVFAAWVGAGVAHFFGSQNLAESSDSTERALKIQQGISKPELIRELSLTPMNKEFMFKPSTMKSIVINELEKHPGYWWVPVIAEGEKGILEDVIHARVFWDEKIKDQSISDMIREVDTNANS